MSDDLTKKLAELGLDENAQQKARQAMGSLGGYVAAREDKLQQLIERTASQVDERTDRRWTDTVGRVRSGLLTGMSRLAAEKPAEDQPSEEEPEGGDSPER